MTQRSLNVVHLLVPRRTKGVVQFLFSPHARWRASDGKPVLALPAKKYLGSTAGSGEAGRRDDAVVAIFREDLGVPEPPPPDPQRMSGVRMSLVSPAFGTPTDYAISPVIARVPVTRHAGVARRLHGEWLTSEAALAQADLSPTARLVLKRVGPRATEWVSRPVEMLNGSACERAWTEGLLAARDGDMDLFGSVFEEMKLRLCSRLRGHPWTRALTDNLADVEDALSEAAMNALEHLHTFDPARGGGLSWVWSITRNCAVSTLRKRGHTVSLFAPDAQDAADRLSAACPEPPRLAEVREELSLARDRIAQTLRKAGPLDRRIWDLRMEQGMSYADIATELDMPLGSVATRVHRLRKSCRETPDR